MLILVENFRVNLEANLIVFQSLVDACSHMSYQSGIVYSPHSLCEHLIKLEGFEVYPVTLHIPLFRDGYGKSTRGYQEVILVECLDDSAIQCYSPVFV